MTDYCTPLTPRNSWGLFMLRLGGQVNVAAGGNVMPWVLNASGECETETDEAEMIAAVHDALIPMENGLREAKLSTQHHGLVDLLHPEADADDTE